MPRPARSMISWLNKRSLGRFVATWLVALGSVGAGPLPVLARQGESMHEAEIVAKQAMQYFQNGQFLLAAELYRQAFRIDPAHPDYLYGVGRAEQRAGRWQEALAAFENLIALLPASEPLSVKARREVEVIKKARDAAVAPAPAAIPAPPVAAPQPPTAQPKRAEVAPPAISPPQPQPKSQDVAPLAVHKTESPAEPPQDRGLPVAALGVAGAAALAGLGLAGVAWWQQGQLDDFRRESDQLYDPARITPAQVRERQGTVNGLWWAGAAAGGVALASAGVAAWLWPTKTQRVAVLPAAGGLLLTARF